MSAYPPEVQAVLDAAARVVTDDRKVDAMSSRWSMFVDAVDAYRKSIAPPEPFEAFVGVLDDGQYHGSAIYTKSNILVKHWPQVWRCTVTPTERVK